MMLVQLSSRCFLIVGVLELQGVVLQVVCGSACEARLVVDHHNRSALQEVGLLRAHNKSISVLTGQPTIRDPQQPPSTLWRCKCCEGILHNISRVPHTSKACYKDNIKTPLQETNSTLKVTPLA